MRCNDISSLLCPATTTCTQRVSEQDCLHRPPISTTVPLLAREAPLTSGKSENITVRSMPDGMPLSMRGMESSMPLDRGLRAVTLKQSGQR